jgi:glycosyltransferase involved in cell wall biosynthesis
MKISVIIPTFNEEKYIKLCLESLSKQTLESEIIVVDDGSTDNTYSEIQKSKVNFKIENLNILKQKHLGPGAARNLGAKSASGDILVFVDADMTFSPDFLNDLVVPIKAGNSKGTFSKNEKVANWKNIWAKAWNFNQNLVNDLRIPNNYPQQAPVFRAILKSEFDRVSGYDVNLGWVDDWSLSKKLGHQSTVTNALYYHYNPESLSEVFKQAKWIGKNVFLTGNIFLTIQNIIRYSLPVSIGLGIYKSIKYGLWQFIIFKIIYDLGIIIGILSTLFSKNRNK